MRRAPAVAGAVLAAVGVVRGVEEKPPLDDGSGGRRAGGGGDGAGDGEVPARVRPVLGLVAL